MSIIDRPRMAEDADSLYRAFQAASIGRVFVSGYGFRHPTARVPAWHDFWIQDGELHVVVGAGSRPATKAEVREFHKSLEQDQVQIVVMTVLDQNVLCVLHQASGLGFSPDSQGAA